MPQWHMSSAEWQRRESQAQDPYPDAATGPDTGVRPRGFNQQRPDPIRTKDRAYSSGIRRQFAPQPGSVDGPGAMYPEAVRVD